MLILDQQLLDSGLAQATHQFNLLDLNEKLDLPGDWDRFCKHDIVLEHIGKRSIPISALERCRCELDVSHATPILGEQDPQSSRRPGYRESTNRPQRYGHSL
jgi:hypothetical protein